MFCVSTTGLVQMKPQNVIQNTYQDHVFLMNKAYFLDTSRYRTGILCA